MKTQIQHEGSIPIRKSEIRNGPSVVARLMGMDSIPPYRSTVIDAKESKVPKHSKPNIYIARKDSILDGSPRSAPFRQTKCKLLSYGNNTSIISNSNYIINSSKKKESGLPPRQHPQEEVLQKFKKDFEAWQTSKMLEKSKTIIVESGVQKQKFVQILAQENLNKEKMAKYKFTQKKALELEETVLPKIELKVGVPDIILPKNESKVCVNDSEKIVKLKQLKLNKVQLKLNKVKERREKSPSPTRIVILKPCFERKNEMIQDSSFKFSDSNKMVDFLEEVKERLRLEIEGKGQHNSTSNKQKDGKNEINNSTNQKQIARDIAKQIRENVTREMDKKLTRSQPFKLHNFEPDSSNLIIRDTGRILSERLKNVLRNETGTERPRTGLTGTSLTTDTEPSRASFLIKRRERVKSMSEFPNVVNMENDKNETRSKLDSIESINADVASPRSLIRSFSAPISSTNLGKLLLDDLNTNSNRYEEKEMEVRRSRKEYGFGLRGKVSNLRGKLFRKKTESVKRRINTVDVYPLKVVKTIPHALVNFGNNQENFIEIPPSPASISSSSHNESSVIANNNSSPVSPLEVSSYVSRNSFRDVSFKFPGSSPSPSPARQVQNEENKDIIFTEYSKKNEIIEILSPEQAYVKEILITAGLYENKDDLAPRSLYFQIFTEMEETYSKHRKDHTDQDPQEMNPDILIDRKLLFDLANESMEALYGPLRNSGTLNEWVRTSDGLPSGRILLYEIWNQMIIFSNPPMDELQTIDNMVGRDVKIDSWTSELYEEKDALCKRVAFVIFAELMDDFLQEMGRISDY